jgi:hypothetical protein
MRTFTSFFNKRAALMQERLLKSYFSKEEQTAYLNGVSDLQALFLKEEFDYIERAYKTANRYQIWFMISFVINLLLIFFIILPK